MAFLTPLLVGIHSDRILRTSTPAWTPYWWSWRSRTRMDNLSGANASSRRYAALLSKLLRSRVPRLMAVHLQHLVPWDEFSKRFYQYLGSSLPDKSRRRYSEIFARTNYLCLKTILTNGTPGLHAPLLARPVRTENVTTLCVCPHSWRGRGRVCSHRKVWRDIEPVRSAQQTQGVQPTD